MRMSKWKRKMFCNVNSGSNIPKMYHPALGEGICAQLKHCERGMRLTWIFANTRLLLTVTQSVVSLPLMLRIRDFTRIRRPRDLSDKFGSSEVCFNQQAFRTNLMLSYHKLLMLESFHPQTCGTTVTVEKKEAAAIRARSLLSCLGPPFPSGLMASVTVPRRESNSDTATWKRGKSEAVLGLHLVKHTVKPRLGYRAGSRCTNSKEGKSREPDNTPAHPTPLLTL